MLPPSPREFKDIYVVFELMETDLHQARFPGVEGRCQCRGTNSKAVLAWARCCGLW